MAENRESIILDVQLDAGAVANDLTDLAKRINSLKEYQKILNAEIAAGNDVNGEYQKKLLEVKEQLSWTQKQAKGLSATTKLLTADTKTYSDSLNGERQKLADMQKAYDQLDKEQRESEGGKAFLQALREQHDAVLELESASGRMQRNVGNYPKTISAVIPGFDKVTGVMDKMGVSFESVSTQGMKAFRGLGDSAKAFGKAMITPPVGIIVVVLGAILAALQKLREAFKKNDEASTNLQVAFSALQPVLNIINKAFDALALGVSKVIVAFSKMVEAVSSLVPGYAEAAAAAGELVVAQDNLEQAERDYAVNSAKRSAQVAELRAKVAEKEKYSVEERRDMLEQAIALETQDLEESRKIANEKLRILQQTAKQNADTSDETAAKIAQAQAEVYNVERDYNEKKRALNKQLSTFDAELTADQKANAQARMKAREAEAKQAEALERERAKNAADIQRLAADFAVSQIEDEDARAIAARKIAGEREIAELRARLADRTKLTDDAFMQLQILIAEKEAALNDELIAMADDAAAKRTDAEIENYMRLLQMRQELADTPEEELELQQELLNAQMEQELAAANLTEEEKLLIRQTFLKKAKELDNEYNAHLVKTAEDAKKQYRAALLSTAAQASDVFGAMGSLLDLYGEQNEEAAKASKAFGLMAIIADEAIALANTATTISEAVHGATKAAAATGIAAPITLPIFITTMVGAVMGALGGIIGTIASAKQLLSSAPAFADGGVIGGYTSTPSRADDTYAHVASGEMVLNAGQQAQLFQLANGGNIGGGFDYAQLAQMMASAVSELPAPVMDYREFTTFEKRVANFNEIAKI